MIAVGETAISVGTDSEQVVDLLEPWLIADYDDSDVALFDYGVALDPQPRDSDGTSPKPLPRLARGSYTLMTSRDPKRITDALLQCLATHKQPARRGTLRIELTPLLRGGRAVLAPPRRVLPMSERWLESRGITRIDTVSVILEPDALTVEWDPPLGSDVSPEPVPVVGWFLPVSGSGMQERQFTSGRAVAQAMGLTLDTTADNAAWHLEQLARCVQQLSTHVAPSVLADWNDALQGPLAV